MFETNLVVNTCVVHKGIDLTELRDGLLHHRFAVFWRGNVHGYRAGPQLQIAELSLQLPACLRVAIHGNRNSALLRAISYYRRANSLCAAGHQDNLVLELQIHCEGAWPYGLFARTAA